MAKLKPKRISLRLRKLSMLCMDEISMKANIHLRCVKIYAQAQNSATLDNRRVIFLKIQILKSVWKIKDQCSYSLIRDRTASRCFQASILSKTKLYHQLSTMKRIGGLAVMLIHSKKRRWQNEWYVRTNQMNSILRDCSILTQVVLKMTGNFRILFLQVQSQKRSRTNSYNQMKKKVNWSLSKNLTHPLKNVKSTNLWSSKVQ